MRICILLKKETLKLNKSELVAAVLGLIDGVGAADFKKVGDYKRRKHLKELAFLLAHHYPLPLDVAMAYVEGVWSKLALAKRTCKGKGAQRKPAMETAMKDIMTMTGNVLHMETAKGFDRKSTATDWFYSNED